MSQHPALQFLRLSEKGKVVSAAEAVRLIRDGDTVATGGFVGIGFAEEIAIALEELYPRERSRRAVYAGQADEPRRWSMPPARATARIAASIISRMRAWCKRVIGGHWGLVPKLQQLAISNQIEAYNLPQGVITHLFRDIAARRPAHISRGRHRHLRRSAQRRRQAERAHHRGSRRADHDRRRGVPVLQDLPDQCRHHPRHDRRSRRQPHHGEGGADARGAGDRDGRAQFRRHRHRAGRARRRERHAQSAPGEDPRHPGRLRGGRASPRITGRPSATQYNPAFSSEIRVRAGSLPPMPMSERKIIARRAAFELKANSVVNLGIGMPEGIAAVANEEKIIDLITLTAEPGVIGGIPASGLNFGAAINTQAVIDQPYQFDFYDGGGLDIAFLGLAQADRARQSQRQQIRAQARRRRRLHQHQPERQEGGVRRHVQRRQAADRLSRTASSRSSTKARSRKFVETVEHVTFSGRLCGRARRRPVLYVTERCVFTLDADGLELIEVAPGIDIERDILAQMDFKPTDSARAVTDGCAHLPREARWTCADDMLAIPLDQRFTYDAQQNLFFINFERFAVRSQADIKAIAKAVEAKLASLGHRVYAIVNYDNFSIPPELLDEYSAMVRCAHRPLLFRRLALHDVRLPAHQARRSAGRPRPRPAHLRERRRSAVGRARKRRALRASPAFRGRGGKAGSYFDDPSAAQRPGPVTK